jgi:hypothetical protein
MFGSSVLDVAIGLVFVFHPSAELHLSRDRRESSVDSRTCSSDAAKELPANIKTAVDAIEKTAAGDAKKCQAGVEGWYNSDPDS